MDDQVQTTAPRLEQYDEPRDAVVGIVTAPTADDGAFWRLVADDVNARPYMYDDATPVRTTRDMLLAQLLADASPIEWAHAHVEPPEWRWFRRPVNVDHDQAVNAAEGDKGAFYGALIVLKPEGAPPEVDTTCYAPLRRAESLAPAPVEQSANKDDWKRYFVAQALGAYTAFRDAAGTVGANPVPGSRPDLGLLISLAVASTAAAVALDSPPDVLATALWDMTPGAGALNGEYEDWLIEQAVRLGINPAHINHYLVAEHFAVDQREG